MSDEAPTTNEVREAAATDGFVHRIEPTAFDRWLAWKCADTLRNAAYAMPRGSGSSGEYWDGVRVDYDLYERSPNDRTPQSWLRAEADRIEARGAL